MQANSLCLRRKTSSILIKETTAEHCLDLSCHKWIHAVIPVLTHIPFQPTAQPAFHHCLLLVPSLTLPWPSALMSCSAQSHRRDAHDVLLKDSDLKQVTFTPLSYKKNTTKLMKCTVTFPFLLWSLYFAKMVQRDLNVNESKFLTCTSEHETYLATTDDSCILPLCSKILHP